MALTVVNLNNEFFILVKTPVVFSVSCINGC